MSLDAPDEDDIVVIGAHLLSIAYGFQSLLAQQRTPGDAIDHPRRLPGPPSRFEALDVLAESNADCDDSAQVSLRVDELEAGMIIHDAVTSTAGLMLLAAGRQVTRATIEKIRSYAESSGVVEPTRALSPPYSPGWRANSARSAYPPCPDAVGGGR